MVMDLEDGVATTMDAPELHVCEANLESDKEDQSRERAPEQQHQPKRLRMEVPDPAPLRIGNVLIHDTHAISITKGLAWCTRCGCFGSIAGQTRSRCVKFALRCMPPTLNDRITNVDWVMTYCLIAG